MGATTTAVFVTHDVREAVLLADRVIVFSKAPGRIVQDIRIDLPRPRLSEVRRSQPFTRYEERILAALYGQPKQDESHDEVAAARVAAGK
jgi:NitT/TauT family transport system ATP-binding protein